MPALPGSDTRPGRMMQIGQALVRRGHGVLWWASGFHHYRRAWLGPREGRTTIQPGFEVRWLPSRGYKRNLGLGRIVDHRQSAKAFRALSREEARPDLI